MIFIGKKVFLNRVYSDRSELDLSDKNIKISVESYDEKTAEYDRNFYVTEKRIVSKLSKISIPNVDILWGFTIAQIDD